MQPHCQTENLVEETLNGSDAVGEGLEWMEVDDEFWSECFDRNESDGRGE